MRLEGGFIQNLGRVYGIYTPGFLGFVILMAILESGPECQLMQSAGCLLVSRLPFMR